jgi:NAD(P)H-flavin reductase
MLALHYRSTGGVTDAQAFDQLLSETSILTLRGPSGDVFVDSEEARPLLLISGGTGAAQALSIITELALRGSAQTVTLVACADTEQDFYFKDYLNSLNADWLKTVCIADPNRSSDNAGLRWLVEHAPGYQRHRAIICGSPQFVYAVEDALVEAGTSLTLESDVFAYAPRSRQVEAASSEGN